MTSYGEVKAMKWNVLLIPHLCLYSQKDFQQVVGHSSDLDQKQSGIPLTKKDQEENEMERERGSPRQVRNRRRRTREGPKRACVLTPLQSGWHTQGEG